MYFRCHFKDLYIVKHYSEVNNILFRSAAVTKQSENPILYLTCTGKAEFVSRSFFTSFVKRAPSYKRSGLAILNTGNKRQQYILQWQMYSGFIHRHLFTGFPPAAAKPRFSFLNISRLSSFWIFGRLPLKYLRP